jgi:hypothetical protein
MGEADAAFRTPPKTRIVRTSVRQSIAHGEQTIAVHEGLSGKDSSNATHG